MNRRNLFVAFALGMSLIAAPGMAKKKKQIVATPQPVLALSTIIDADATHDPDNVLLLDLSNGGRVAIRLVPAWAPTHIERIKTLTKQGFYNGVIFHRVIDGFMAQTGDPTGTGQGGSKLPDLKSEFNRVPHMRGTVSMARTNDPNSANSQFFIVFYPRFALDNRYTNFGRVIGGMNVVDAIERGEPPEHPTKIIQASLGSENKPQMMPPPPPPVEVPTIVTPPAPVTPPPAAAPVKAVVKKKAG